MEILLYFVAAGQLLTFFTVFTLYRKLSGFLNRSVVQAARSMLLERVHGSGRELLQERLAKHRAEGRL